MAQNVPNPQFTAMMNNLEYIANATRALQNEVMEVHSALANINIPSYGGQEKSLEERLEHINQLYDNIEAHAHQLPNQTVMTSQLERLVRFLNDAHVDLETKNLYNKTVEMTTWAETASQLAQMNADFLRSVLGIRRRSVMTDRPISYSNFTQESNPQRVFEQTLATVINEPSNKKIGLTAKYLEMSTLSAIIEFKFGSYFEKQYVCTLKMLMVVNNGMPDQVMMIAPHEEWSYLDGLVENQVDIHKQSKYEVYRKMTIQANIHLISSILSCFEIRNPHTLSFTLNFFAKFATVFQQKCRVCKKIMKNFLPPLIMDVRSPKSVMHESCR